MNRTSYLRGKLLVPVIALAGYVSPSVAAVTGELSVDGRVLTVEVAESETFDPALVDDTVETMV